MMLKIFLGTLGVGALLFLAFTILPFYHIHCDTSGQQHTPDKEISVWFLHYRSIDATQMCKDWFGPEFEAQIIGDHWH